MNTKVLYEQQNKVLSNSFLNNQNYILGKTEKKLLLSKYFMEYVFNKIIYIFSFFNSLFYNEKYYIGNSNLVFYSFIYFFSLFFSIFSGNFSYIYFFFIIFFPIIIWITYRIIRDFEFIKIKNKSEFIFIKGFSLFNIAIISLIIIYLINYFFIYSDGFIHIFLSNLLNSGLLGFIIFFSTLIMGFFIDRTLNILNIIFLPVLLIIGLFIFIISYISTYIIKIPKILKFFPYKNLLKGFDEINLNGAKNIYYNIKLK